MGMNYYLRKKDDSKFNIPSNAYMVNAGRLAVTIKEKGETEVLLNLDKCVDTVDKLHIGKSSFGWNFSLCIYPTLNIYNLKDWIELFDNSEYEILDEEDRVVSKEEMLSTITERKSFSFDEYSTLEEFEKSVVDNYNNLEKKLQGTPRIVKNYDEYLEKNNAYRGKNGLLGHKSTILDLRNEEMWKGFLPILSTFFVTDGTYDLTTDWDFS